MDILNIEITSKKVRGNNVDFSTSKIALIEVRGNNVDFKTIEITSKKVRGNNADFSLSSTFGRNINVESAWIRRGVLLG